MKTVLALLALLLVGCSSIPSMRYCDRVEYIRNGTKATLHAECNVPAGGL